MCLKRSVSCQHRIRIVHFFLRSGTPHAANNTLQLRGGNQGGSKIIQILLTESRSCNNRMRQWQVTFHPSRYQEKETWHTHAQKLLYVSWSMYLSGLMLIAHLISIGLCFGVFNYSKTEDSITWKASNHNCSTRVLIFPWKRSDWTSPALLSRAVTNAF